jgi:hypothetical protein
MGVANGGTGAEGVADADELTADAPGDEKQILEDGSSWTDCGPSNAN